MEDGPLATDTRIRIKRNPYHGYEVSFRWWGWLQRFSFNDTRELSDMMAEECMDENIINTVVGRFEEWEWDEPEYPLGVSYVGKSVTSRTPLSAPFSSETPVKPAFFTDVELRPTYVDAVNAKFWKWVAGIALVALGIVLCGRGQ